MTDFLIDAPTINAVLKVLNQPVNNATHARAIVREMAINAGLKFSDDTELSDGDFSPWMGGDEMRKRALRAIENYENWCHENEAQWTGWGDQIVPEAAMQMTWQAKEARALISGEKKVATGAGRQPVAVKPLEWTEHPCDGSIVYNRGYRTMLRALSAVGAYFVAEHDGEYRVEVGAIVTRLIGFFPSLEAAKSGAQTDCEVRILADLVVEHEARKAGA